MIVYVVLRNTDMTEGRGHMVLDCIFSNRKAAETYLDTKLGIMNRKLNWVNERNAEWQLKEFMVFNNTSHKHHMDEEEKYLQLEKKIGIDNIDFLQKYLTE